ncbi:hypothetical protein BT63DRAFT_6273 [Microthyrium microscopicum]|uniref:Tafazzin family protein n=1 Tax=Microthyrium microscopicum TaxID=703497 RepID=A0A6A6US26_9PEZI|nr:hypothetical protein BT63DRAFT_6273 [Microthyrium microscopicum]
MPKPPKDPGDDTHDLSRPSLQWRAASRVTIAAIGLFSKSVLNFLNSTRIYGLDAFVKLLDERKDVSKRKKGLLTYSNHLSVVDDPFIWGALPARILCSPNTMRWSLGSEDICFVNGPNSLQSRFFTSGQVLPTHRLMFSPHGGPFQPTMTQAIRLLNAGPFLTPTPPHPYWPTPTPSANPPPPADEHTPLTDPFADNLPVYSYSTTGSDSYTAPTAYGTRRHAWLHVFPEGRVHQHPEHRLRYFKWGVARLILETEPCPDVVPIFLEGIKDIMALDRPSPKWLPRIFKSVSITFGARVDEGIFSQFRERWRTLRERAGLSREGEEMTEELMHGQEAQELRIAVVKTLRDEMEKLRRSRGYGPDDPKSGLVETWKEEGSLDAGRKADQSLVGET